MGYIDYSKEPKSDIAFVDMKSFYASVECVDLGLDPLTTSLCVMSGAEHSSGLILAASPTFKKVFGQHNVGRKYELPFDVETRRFSYQNARRRGLSMDKQYVQHVEYWAQRTYIVPPRMDVYIAKNMEIQEIFQQYASPSDILPYSIDEGFLDLTSSLNYFYPDPSLTRREKLDLVSRDIQRAIYRKTGIYATVGMSNSNPLLAKLALDIEAKHNRTMRANWSYEDVEEKVWQIPELTDFWGIGRRTKLRLEKLGIHSVRELANSNPDLLKKEFGVMGVQLWFHANGVDESNVHTPYQPKSHGLGNSQILPRDYTDQREIELVLGEMAEQVAIRMRKRGKKARQVEISLAFSKKEGGGGIHRHQKITATDQTSQLISTVLALFREKYQGEAVRQIAVRYGDFVGDDYQEYSLFQDPDGEEKKEKLQEVIDHIRQEFGFLSVQKATVLTTGSRAIARSKLVGGHSAGGLDGLS